MDVPRNAGDHENRIDANDDIKRKVRFDENNNKPSVYWEIEAEETSLVARLVIWGQRSERETFSGDQVFVDMLDKYTVAFVSTKVTLKIAPVLST